MSSGTDTSATESDEACDGLDIPSDDDAISKPTDAKYLWRSGGILPTSICLSKAAMGIGMLSLAGHTANVGLAFQFGGLLVGGLLTVISIQMIGDVALAIDRWSYEDICDELTHPIVGFATGLVNTLNCLGGCVGYLMTAGDVFQTWTLSSDEGRTYFIIGVGLGICLPLSLARHVSFMRYLAMLSVLSLVFLVITVAYILGQNGKDETATNQFMWSGKGGASLPTYVNSLNTLVFAYNNQFNVPQLAGELQPRTNKRVVRVGLLSTFMAFCMYGLVSTLGLLAFGDHQEDSLVINLKPYRTDLMVKLSLAFVVFSVLMAFEFHVFPVRQFCAFTIRKLRQRKANDDASDAMIWGRSLTRWFDLACAFVTVILSIVIAIKLKSLTKLLDFIGAFASAYTSYVIPAIWVLALRKSYSVMYLGLTVAILALGLGFVTYGTYSAVAH